MKDIKESKLVALMGTDVKIGMNEVVNVFVSKYEDDLYGRKEIISSELAKAKKEFVDFTKSVKDAFTKLNKPKYTQKIVALDLSSSVDNVKMYWTEKDINYNVDRSIAPKAPFCMTNVKVVDNVSKSSLTKYVFDKITKVDASKRVELQDNINQSTEELKEILGLIKDVSRKERQIRGKISEAKLQQAGYDDLVSNPELLQLIEIK